MNWIVVSHKTFLGSMNLSLSGKVGMRAVIYYLSTTILAVILGIVLVVSIRPGDSGDIGRAEQQDPAMKKNVTTADTLMDLLRNSFPPNLFQATTQQYKTLIIYPGEEIVSRTKHILTVIVISVSYYIVLTFKKVDPKTNFTVDPSDKETWDYKKTWSNNPNLLGLIVFSIVTGWTG